VLGWDLIFNPEKSKPLLVYLMGVFEQTKTDGIILVCLVEAVKGIKRSGTLQEFGLENVYHRMLGSIFEYLSLLTPDRLEDN
jgi:hypothetical protein